MSTAYARLPLNALRVFEAVASRLSFADAAEALHVTPAAVSQQVKSLEDYLQVQLFKRAGRRIELTAEGQQLLEGAAEPGGDQVLGLGLGLSLGLGRGHVVTVPSAPKRVA